MNIKVTLKTLLLTIFTSILFCMPVYAESFIATAYDLSPQSCGRSKDHPHYGLTASGYSLKGHTWASARTISADLSILPLGTQLYISFPEPYSHMNGTYTVRDTGGGVHGSHIDVFFGEDAHHEAIQFGRRRVYIKRM